MRNFRSNVHCLHREKHKEPQNKKPWHEEPRHKELRHEEQWHEEPWHEEPWNEEPQHQLNIEDKSGCTGVVTIWCTSLG